MYKLQKGLIYKVNTHYYIMLSS